MAADWWTSSSLGQLIEIKHGFAFQSKFFSDEPPGDILLTPGNFAIGGGFKGDKLKYYSGPVPTEFVLAQGDLLVTMTDLSKNADTLGYPAIAPKPENGRYLHNQRLGRVSVKSGAPLREDFLYYLMRTREYRCEVVASATGTTVKHTSPSRILGYKFQLPPLPEQRAIAHILGTLDDKIELNRRMNETLEAMARALFKSWFVDFDPVRANVEGRQPLGVDPIAAEFFPHDFEQSRVGDIPHNWKTQTFDETIEVIGGGTPKTSVPDYWGGDIPWFTVVDAPNASDVYVIGTEKKITRAGVENSSTRLLPVGTTILSARGTVGKCALVGVPMAMNQSCYGIQGKNGSGAALTYFRTRHLVSVLQQRTHGSVFDTITRDTLQTVDVVVPPVGLAARFEEAVVPILERILSNLKESRTLAALRDALLPKLLSGQIRVKEAERVVAEVV